MQVKIITRYHFTPTGMAKIKNIDNHKWWQGSTAIVTLIAGESVKWYNQIGELFGNLL